MFVVLRESKTDLLDLVHILIPYTLKSEFHTVVRFLVLCSLLKWSLIISGGAV